jgi:hypothetical protein
VSLLFAILAWMTSLVPGSDHTPTATSIARVILEEPPLFKGDESRVKTAAYMVSVAFRESALNNGAVGDHGHARCMFQLWNTPGRVLTDPELCTRIAMQRIRESMKACGPGNELGVYLVGPKGCESELAKRRSRDRMLIANRLAKDVGP